MEDTERDREIGGARTRGGDPDELVTVMRVLDAELLGADAGEIRDRLAADDCLVAGAPDQVVGALVFDGDYIETVAISPSRRGQGVGTRSVHAALDHRGRLIVDFDEGVKPSYEPLGLDIEDQSDDGR